MNTKLVNIRAELERRNANPRSYEEYRAAVMDVARERGIVIDGRWSVERIISACETAES